MSNPRGQQRDKPYRDALRRAIARAEQNENDPHALDRIAERHLAQAASGDMQAIKELADRLDGKATQPIAGDNEHDALTLVVTGVPRAGD
jgi:hypothetical protein